MDEQRPQPTGEDSNQIIEERRAKLRALREQGIAYPNDFRREHLAADLARQHEPRTARRSKRAP